MKKILIFIAVILGVITIGYTCSCVTDVSLEDKYNMSSLIFIGKVLSIEKADLGYIVEFDVGSVYKGEFKDRISLYTNKDSASCGFNFEIGNHYLVYANDYGQRLETGLCSGNLLSNQSKDDIDFLENKMGGGQTDNLKNIVVELDSENNVVYYDLTVWLLTPCHNLDTEVIIGGDNISYINLNVDVSESNEICIQVIDEKSISGKVYLQENVDVFNIYYNGMKEYVKTFENIDDGSNDDTNDDSQNDRNLFEMIIDFFKRLFGI